MTPGRRARAVSRAHLSATVLPAPARGTAPAHDDVVVAIVHGPWSAARFVRAARRTTDLMEGVVVVGWCGERELRLLRARDADRVGRRLAPVVDPLVRVLGPAPGPGPAPAARSDRLTMTNLPDGHRLFDDMVTGRTVVAAQLSSPGPEAVHRWWDLLAGTGWQVVRAGDGPGGGGAVAAPVVRAV